MSDILNKSWFMEFKPQDIDDLIFDNDEHKRLMEQWIQNEKVDGNVIFYGSYGLGKTASAELLITKLIKSQNDLFVAKERSVKEIKERLIPFLQKQTMNSKEKIVYIEEMDKLHPDAFNLLKTGLMEKYQDDCSFICCTNYIKKIESATLSRFNHKIAFQSNNIDGIVERIKYILNKKDAEYDEEELIEYIKNNYILGIRDIINSLQNNYISNDGKIDFSSINKTKGSIEDKIINIIMNMCIATAKSKNIADKKKCLDKPTQSQIAVQYKEFISLVHNNSYEINYDYIYSQIEKSINFVPAKLICGKYIDSQQFTKFQHLNLIGFNYELMKSLAEL